MSNVSRDTERLNRAIDRLLERQPVPVFDNEELAGLVDLAGVLQRELPRDLPDPAFREALREQLIEPRPRLVVSRSDRLARRSPLALAGGAIAAVLVVAVAVGLVAAGQFGLGRGDADSESNAEFLATDTPISAIATATATVGSIAVVSTREPEFPTPMAKPVNIPPVDAAHLELGALSTSESASPAVVEDISYHLASALPESPESAPVYRFAVPEVDALTLMNRLTNALDLDGEMTTRSVRGKTVISFTSTNGTTFTWMPASGAFACNLSGEARVQGEHEEIIAAAYSWLRASGFPVQDPAASPIVSEMEAGTLRVDFPVETAPEVAVGHPLTVSVVIDADGVIRTVSGYWLQLVETHDLGLLSPEEAW